MFRVGIIKYIIFYCVRYIFVVCMLINDIDIYMVLKLLGYLELKII